MSYLCPWCSARVGRVWEIPRAAGRDKQWVCKSCHSDYFNGDRDAQGNRIYSDEQVESGDGEEQDRVI